jgi:hypothetical protein
MTTKYQAQQQMSLGEIAYTSYCATLLIQPNWQLQSDAIKAAWESAALAVAAFGE